MFQAAYHSNNYRLDRWFRRDELVQCHLNLDAALGLILECLYLANGTFVPRPDYLFYLAKDLPWLPERVGERFSAAARLAAPSREEALRRRRFIADLLLELRDHVRLDEICPWPHDESVQKTGFYFDDSELAGMGGP